MAYYQGGPQHNANGQQIPPPLPPPAQGYPHVSFFDGENTPRDPAGASPRHPAYGYRNDSPNVQQQGYPYRQTPPTPSPPQFQGAQYGSGSPPLTYGHRPAQNMHGQGYNPQDYVAFSPSAAQPPQVPAHYPNGQMPGYPPPSSMASPYGSSIYQTTGFSPQNSRASPTTSQSRYQQPYSSSSSPHPAYVAYNHHLPHSDRSPTALSDSASYQTHGYTPYAPPHASQSIGVPLVPTLSNDRSYGTSASSNPDHQSFFNSPSPEIREESDLPISPAQIPPPVHPQYSKIEPDSSYFPHSSGMTAGPSRYSPQRAESRRHPQERALPVIPDTDPAFLARYDPSLIDEQTLDELAQDDLFDEVANAVMATARPRIHSQDLSGRMPVTGMAQLELSHSDPINGIQSDINRSPYQSDRSGTEDDYGYDSDAEAAAGLEAMRMAEAQEAADRSREVAHQAAAGRSPDVGRSSPGGQSDDTDYGGAVVDMSSFDGGYYGPTLFGGGPSQAVPRPDFPEESPSRNLSVKSGQSALNTNESGQPGRTSSTTSVDYSSHRSHSGRSTRSPVARVDYAGTGGLADPALTRKLSFDEGDESQYQYDDITPEDGSNTLRASDYYSMIGARPLPEPPIGGSSATIGPGDFVDSIYPSMAPLFPGAPDAIAQSHHGVNPSVRYSMSLNSHSSGPLTAPPARAKTDAEERKRQSAVRGFQLVPDPEYQSSTISSTPSLGLDLPTLPVGRRFQPSKFMQRDFDRCTEPWALSSIASWVRLLAEGETELKRGVLVEALIALFANKVPNISVADTEALAARVVTDMFDAGVLLQEEEWLKFGQGAVSGVLYQPTGRGCYSTRVHEHNYSGRCYSHHCQRTVKKLALNLEEPRNKDGWMSFYNLTREDTESSDKKEIERQNVLHEIIQTEDDYMDQLTVLQLLYREALMSAQPPIIPSKKLKTFERDVFGKLDAVRSANTDFLLPQLKYRQKEQGPYISGFSDIFRDWIRKAKAAYIDYAAGYPNANFLMRQENEKNLLFHSFLENARNNGLSNRLGWETFLKAPITRLQRYGLLLSTAQRLMTQESEERANLQIAIDEIRAVTLICDTRVDEATRKVSITDLTTKLVLRDGMQHIKLNLGHLGRELIYRGELQRIGGTRFTWLDTTAFLFDHYLVLAKTIPGALGRSERYDVSKMPIPMDLLILESVDDDPVIKSKGIASVTSVTTKAGNLPEARGIKHASSPSPIPGALAHSTTNISQASASSGSSSKTLVTNTNLEGQEKIYYPFRIRHLGKEAYILYANSAASRTEWCDKIIEAKTKHARSLFAQGAEPFRLRIMADAAFAYDAATLGQKTIVIEGTPLSRAIAEVEKTYAQSGRHAPICRARVNCAATFVLSNGKQMIAAGADYGVYISEVGDARGWSRAITIPKVTQIAVLEDFNLFLLISDKSLIAYHLNVVCPIVGRESSSTGAEDSNRKAPQKLSGAKDIGFFATGRMKDRTLLFYKKRDTTSSVFKILEPVLQKSSGTTRASRFSGFTRTSVRGATDFFREYDDFYIPGECSSISLFNSSLAVSTTKGFEILNLDKKTPWTIPDLKPAIVHNIAQRVSGSDPVGMFRLIENSAHNRNPSTGDGATLNWASNSFSQHETSASSASSEFLCVYSDCAVYINKHGDVSRSAVMEFVGKIKAAALYGPYLILFDVDFVEIRDVQNGRLKQIIAGRDVRLIDDGRSAGANSSSALADTGSSTKTIKLAMQHPTQERVQIIVELVLNESRRA